MKKTLASLIIIGLLTSTASATMVPKPVPFSVTGSSAVGAGFVGGFIGFVAVLVGYDIYRRWVPCASDPLRLGGPGFSTPMVDFTNVKAPPVCAGDPRTVVIRGK